MKTIPRFAATIFAGASLLGLAGVGVASDVQAQPGPFPQWCPGEYWDPGWGNNWDWNGCHDWRGGPPGGWDRGPGWNPPGPAGGPGWGPGGPPPPGWGPGGPPPPPGWHP
ncbi:hypothetical protein [Mycobacterium rhizamassiliense]|uniref:hypothetical protein n=1 Tax=Mycobacterium rhizamassiliense TaxID=1841860 RepID=UPI00097D44AF|nr:hypothetical protein [Mycobacterium rhizamassiliense]